MKGRKRRNWTLPLVVIVVGVLVDLVLQFDRRHSDLHPSGAGIVGKYILYMLKMRLPFSIDN